MMKPRHLIAALTVLTVACPLWAMAEEPSIEELRIEAERMEADLEAERRLNEIRQIGSPNAGVLEVDLHNIRNDLFEMELETAELEARREVLLSRVEALETRAAEHEASFDERLSEFEERLAAFRPGRADRTEDASGNRVMVLDPELEAAVREAIEKLDARQYALNMLEELRDELTEIEMQLAMLARRSNLLGEKKAELEAQLEAWVNQELELMQKENAIRRLRVEVEVRSAEAARRARASEESRAPAASE